MKITFSILVILGTIIPIMSQSVIGTWQNEEDGVVQSHIEVYEKEGKLFAKVIKVLDGAKVTHCNKCDDELKGQHLEGIHIFYDLKKKGHKWEKGRILDPNKGNVYSCNVELKGDNRLKIRGYIGKPLFGKTFYWDRVL